MTNETTENTPLTPDYFPSLRRAALAVLEAGRPENMIATNVPEGNRLDVIRSDVFRAKWNCLALNRNEPGEETTRLLAILFHHLNQASYAISMLEEEQANR